MESKLETSKKPDLLKSLKATFLRWFVTPARCRQCGGEMEEVNSPSGYTSCKSCGYFE